MRRKAGSLSTNKRRRRFAKPVKRLNAAPASIYLYDGDGYDPRGDRVQAAQAVPVIVVGLLDEG